MKKRTALTLYLTFNFCNLFDAISTVIATSEFGAIELNPVANYVLQISPVLFIALKLLIGFGCGYMLYKYAYKGIAKFGLITANVMYGLLVLWHCFVWYLIFQM